VASGSLTNNVGRSILVPPCTIGNAEFLEATLRANTQGGGRALHAPEMPAEPSFHQPDSKIASRKGLPNVLKIAWSKRHGDQRRPREEKRICKRNWQCRLNVGGKE